MYKNDAWTQEQILLWKCNDDIPSSSVLNYNNVSVVCFGAEKQWDPLGKIQCPTLVRDFNERTKSLKRKAAATAPTHKSATRKLPPNSSRRHGDQSNDFTAFQGLVAEAIVGATDSCGELLHLVKWQGKEELELVPAMFTIMKFPLVVMAFYGNRVNFICSNVD